MPAILRAEWLRRFGDIPGIVYTSSAQIGWISLAGCDDTPEVHAFRFDGKLEETLGPPADAVTSAPPNNGRDAPIQ